jgi:hypothetical protein
MSYVRPNCATISYSPPAETNASQNTETCTWSFRSTTCLQALFIIHDGFHLLSAGTVCVESQLDPFLDQLLGQF